MAKRTKRINNKISRKRLSRKRLSKKRITKKIISRKRTTRRKMMKGGDFDSAKKLAKKLFPQYSKIDGMGNEEFKEFCKRKLENTFGGWQQGIVGENENMLKWSDILDELGKPPRRNAGGVGVAARSEDDDLARAIAASLATPAPAISKRNVVERFIEATGLPADRAMIYLTQPGVNFDINKAVALSFDNPEIGGGAVAPAPVAEPVRAAGGAPIKVFFFDLDNTLTAKELEKRDNLIELAHPTEFSWTYTSQQVIDILTRINADPNSMWYVISAGGNEDVLDMLEGRLGFQANGRVFNIGEDTPKSYHIQQILTRLRDSGNNLKSIAFIDDTPEKITEVGNTIPGIIPIRVNSHFSEDPGHEMRQFWRNIILDNEKRQIYDILDS